MMTMEEWRPPSPRNAGVQICSFMYEKALHESFMKKTSPMKNIPDHCGPVPRQGNHALGNHALGHAKSIHR